MTAWTPSVAFVTGIAGQDGGYLTARLLDRGVEVHGLCRDPRHAAAVELAHPGATAHIGDLRDDSLVRSLIADVEPDLVVNLAGSTSVARSWEIPVETVEVLAVAPVRLLDACWQLDERRGTHTRFVQASSAEIFGDALTDPQDESTPIAPVTPYGAAKAYAHAMAGVYRRRSMHVSSAILYNHESPRRPTSFVARKITHTVAQIARGEAETLTLGNIDAMRDWGFAPDYVAAMLTIAEQTSPADYIVATGVAHTVRDFVAAAFRHVGIDDWQDRVVIDAGLYRPADPRTLVGDSTRLRGLGWAPTVTFDELVSLMVDHDLDQLDAQAR